MRRPLLLLPCLLTLSSPLARAQNSPQKAPDQELRAKNPNGLCEPIWNPIEPIFKTRSSELTLDQLARISEVAQALDDPRHPTNEASEKQSRRILTILNRDSKEFQAAAKSDPSLLQADVVVIGGAGVEAGIFESTLESLAPGVKVILIEAGDGASRTFDSDFFHLNSSETPTSGDTPLLYAPDQLRNVMPEFQGHVYPLARALGNGVHQAQGSFRAKWLLRNRGTSVERLPDGEFIVETSSGLRTRSRVVVFGPGYGPIHDEFFDEPSRELIRASTTELYKTGELAGKAVSFDDLKHFEESLHQAERLHGRNPYRQFPSLDHQIVDLDIAIIGGSDGGAVNAQRFSRAPTHAKRYWFGQKGSTPQEFIESLENKKRYADLIDEIESGEIKTSKSHVLSVTPARHPDGRPGVEVKYENPDGSTSSVIVHFAVLAPGYKEADSSLLHGLVPTYYANTFDPETPGVWDMLKEREQKFKIEQPGLAQSATPNLYAIGVNAGKATGLLSVLRGGGHSVQIAKAVAAGVKYRDALPFLAASPGARTETYFRIAPDFTAGIAAPKIALASLRSRLLLRSRNFQFGAELKLAIRFYGQRVSLSIEGLEQKGAAALLKVLSADAEFQRYLNDYRKRSGTLTFTVPITESGGLRMDHSTVEFRP